MQTRFTIDTTRSTATANISLLASYDNARAKKSKANVQKKFGNDLTVLSLGQRGAFGQAVTIATKLDTRIDTSNLYFYSYNPVTGKIKRIKSTYIIDKNNYLHFKTRVGFDIIISDGPLTVY